jgi:hypothetical protein
LLFAMPALLLTTLSSSPSSSSIHSQLGAHWTAFLFVSTVLALAAQVRATRRACSCALALATLACSYQYGGVLQRNTSSAGAVPFKFGVDAEGRVRGEALGALSRSLPPRAKVASSSLVTSHVSSRPDAYALSNGVLDAEYVIFPTLHSDFVGNEYGTVQGLLQSNAFGVVDVQPPFAMAMKGHETSRNAEVLGLMR